MTDTQRKNLRNNHYNAHFGFEGKTYMAAGGLMSNGISMRTTASVQQLLRTLEAFRQQVQSDLNCLPTAAAKFGATLPPDPDLHFEFFPEGGYGVVDIKSGIRFSLTWSHEAPPQGHSMPRCPTESARRSIS
jgi:hypothetical protein